MRAVLPQLDVDGPDSPDLDVVRQMRVELGGSRHDGDPTLGERGDELRLRASDAVHRADELEVHGPDGCDHADVRPRDRAELGDLAEAAHAHLDDADLRVGLEPAERQRHAQLRVVAPLGRDRARDGLAERREDVLRRRLARGAGDADEASAAAGAEHLADHGHRRELVARDERRRAPLAGVGDEVAPAADGDEEVAGPDPARVDLESRELA